MIFLASAVCRYIVSPGVERVLHFLVVFSDLPQLMAVGAQWGLIPTGGSLDWRSFAGAEGKPRGEREGKGEQAMGA